MRIPATRMPAQRSNLGWWQAVAAAAAQYYAADQAGENGAGMPSGGGGGMSPPMSRGGSTVVSPNIQTEISPQISPVFQQTQSSPGATQAATATQYQPGGQSGRGGDASELPYSGGPSLPAMTAPLLPGFDNYTTRDTLPRFADAGSMIRDVRESQPFNWTPVFWIAGIGVVGLLALEFLKKRRAA